ncbi:response regulator transcription factor [Nocardia sp. NPDC051832]|uniref:response regulator transcription factor n=1 Tax=Nocardia sp. NPDC051832 TaxID=3155673 RepID=UPI003439F9D0
MIRVLIGGALRLPREAMATVVSAIPGVQVVAQVGHGSEVVPCAVRTTPNLAVLDADLPGLDGISAAQRLKATLQSCRVVLLTPPNRPDLLRCALAAEVEGLLSRGASLEALTDTVIRVAHGQRAIEPQAFVEVLDSPGNPLAIRDIEMLRLASQGRTPGEIAAALHLSAGTVRNNLAAINRKIGVRNRIEAIRVATAHGWI